MKVLIISLLVAISFMSSDSVSYALVAEPELPTIPEVSPQPTTAPSPEPATSPTESMPTPLPTNEHGVRVKPIPSPRPYDSCGEHGCSYKSDYIVPDRKCGACVWSETTRITPLASSMPTAVPQSSTNPVQPSAKPKLSPNVPVMKVVHPTDVPQVLSASISATPSSLPQPSISQFPPTLSQLIFNWFRSWFK